ncbi:MAG: hypothetical protein AAEJ04_08440, partial [Planctomycetota bacterium]
MGKKKNQKSIGQSQPSKLLRALCLIGLIFSSLILLWNPSLQFVGLVLGETEEKNRFAAGNVLPDTQVGNQKPTEQKLVSLVSSLEPTEGVVAGEFPGATSSTWSEALEKLVAAGLAETDPSAAIIELLTAEPGMGDRLLFLLLEMEASQNQRDALLVALATALSFDPETRLVAGVEGVRWPNGLESLWHDRSGTILWMAELWVERDPHSEYFDRLLQLPDVLLPWHSLELASLLEKQQLTLDRPAQARVQQLLEISLSRDDPDSLVVAREWIEASNSILRDVALGTIGRSLANDPIGARTLLESVSQAERVSVLESIFSQVPGDHLQEMIQQTADLMLEQEYRGSALLSSFSRGTQLDLESLVYQRGAEDSSESYRNLVLYGSQGGVGRGGQLSPLWAHNLDNIAQTDPSRSV